MIILGMHLLITLNQCHMHYTIQFNKCNHYCMVYTIFTLIWIIFNECNLITIIPWLKFRLNQMKGRPKLDERWVNIDDMGAKWMKVKGNSLSIILKSFIEQNRQILSFIGKKNYGMRRIQTQDLHFCKIFFFFILGYMNSFITLNNSNKALNDYTSCIIEE